MEMEQSLKSCCERNPRIARLEKAHKQLVNLRKAYDENKISFETFSKRLSALEQLIYLY
jgi:hypothetical protein